MKSLTGFINESTGSANLNEATTKQLDKFVEVFVEAAKAGKIDALAIYNADSKLFDGFCKDVASGKPLNKEVRKLAEGIAEGMKQAGELDLDTFKSNVIDSNLDGTIHELLKHNPFKAANTRFRNAFKGQKELTNLIDSIQFTEYYLLKDLLQHIIYNDGMIDPDAYADDMPNAPILDYMYEHFYDVIYGVDLEALQEEVSEADTGLFISAIDKDMTPLFIGEVIYGLLQEVMSEL